MTGRRATSFGTHARTHAHGERGRRRGERGREMDGRRGSRLCRSGVVCASVIHHIHAHMPTEHCRLLGSTRRIASQLDALRILLFSRGGRNRYRADAATSCRQPSGHDAMSLVCMSPAPTMRAVRCEGAGCCDSQPARRSGECCCVVVME